MPTDLLTGLLDDTTSALTAVNLGATASGIDVQLDRLGLVLTRPDHSRLDLAQSPQPNTPLDPQGLRGTDGDDQLDGGPGHEYIYGLAGHDLLLGGGGNDHVWGASPNGGVDGNDTIAAGDGDDYVQANAGDDVVDGGAGQDRLFGGQGDDVLFGGAGDDHVNGNFGKDTLVGGAGADELRGGRDADRIYGGDGNDHLYGDLGADRVTGGAGADVFHYAANDAGFVGTNLVPGSLDTITDFAAGEDRLALPFRPVDVQHATALTPADAYAVAAARLLLAPAGEAVAVQVGQDTLLFYGATGGHVPDSVVDLLGVHAGDITAGSFA